MWDIMWELEEEEEGHDEDWIGVEDWAVVMEQRGRLAERAGK